MQENPEPTQPKSRLQGIFGRRKEQNIKEEMPKLNAKGHKSFGKVHGRGQTHVHPEISQGAMER